MCHLRFFSRKGQCAVIAALLLANIVHSAQAQSVVTYTGQLLNGAAPLSGTYDFQFQLYDASSAGNPVGPLLTVTNVTVADGVFYTELNFGKVFSGKTLYLQTAYGLHPSTGTATYVVQSKRKLAPVSAYSVYAPLSGNTKSLQGQPVSTTAPVTNQVLTWNGTQWAASNAMAGPQGPVGPTGATGAQGPKGSTGAQGPAGTPGTTFTPGTGLSLSGGTLGIAPGSIDHTLLASDSASLSQVSGGLMYTPDNSGSRIDIAYDLLVHGGVIKVNGSGGGDGNNGASARALVDGGPGNGLIINYDNDFGKVVVASDFDVNGALALGTGTIVSANDISIDRDTTVRGYLGVTGNIQCNSNINATSISAKSLQLNGADLAEAYNIAKKDHTVSPLPGMVVSIDPDNTGQMRVCTKPYDTGVGGIISGANGIQPGITLRQAGTVADGTLPVASIGRVWCWCDADAGGPISPSDLLTTSATPGHAMRVTDHDRAQGAILGKAMSSLKSGKGLVLVLVTLQ